VTRPTSEHPGTGPTGTTTVALTVNGKHHQVDVEPRTSLADLLRDHLDLTGTNLGCEHGVCGTCTVLLDGAPVRSCLLLAVQCAGRAVRTVEGLADGDTPHPLQRAFAAEHALQCGFCTPGFLMLLAGTLATEPDLDQDPRRLDEVLSANLCRCTGYAGIRRATLRAAAELRGEGGDGG
jgi:aerobic carbon-monoxide dehydrogenase small subunit